MQYFSCTLMMDKIPKLMQFPLTAFQLTYFSLRGFFTNAIFFFQPKAKKYRTDEFSNNAIFST